FLEAGDDANRLFEQYMEPAFVGFGYGINSGWYNTAKPHKLLGFDITGSVSIANIPTSAQSFFINDAEYSRLRVDPNGPVDGNGNLITSAPTFLGENLPASEIPRLQFLDANGDPTFSITSPTGLGLEEEIGLNAMPSAIFQVGVGLPKGTDLKIRFVPSIETDDFEFDMIGFGIMHDIKQWIPGIKALPFDLSGLVAFTNIETRAALDEPGQAVEFSTNAFTLQGVISKKLSILTVYAGAGYVSTSTDFSLLGTYELDDESELVDPVALSYSDGGLRGNVGMRLKLFFLTLHGEYAIQRYNTLNLGVGISIR
ncbi:MAG: DUF6588 family protein, partial [Bacteroidota bacterium]